MLRTLRIVALLASAMLSWEAWGAAATVANLSGTLSALKPDGTVKLLSQKSEVEAGDVLSTEQNSYARIKFTDGGEVTIAPNSKLKIDAYGFDENAPEKDNFVFSLIKGGLRTITGLVGKRGNRDAYKLNTAVATIGIRGTHFRLLMCQGDCGGKLSDGLHLNVVNGVINARNNGGELDFSAGQFGFVGGIGMQPVLVPKDPGIPAESGHQGGSSGSEGGDTSGAGCYVN
jgi:hypothetical protein